MAVIEAQLFLGLVQLHFARAQVGGGLKAKDLSGHAVGKSTTC
jgi:hypothetical protein